jgi:hypothetical protein
MARIGSLHPEWGSERQTPVAGGRALLPQVSLFTNAPGTLGSDEMSPTREFQWPT